MRNHVLVLGLNGLVMPAATRIAGNVASTVSGHENIRGGLSSIEEKSLGAIAKGGSRPISGLLGVADAPSTPGLYVMDAPGFWPESMTGFAADRLFALLIDVCSGMRTWGEVLGESAESVIRVGGSL